MKLAINHLKKPALLIAAGVGLIPTLTLSARAQSFSLNERIEVPVERVLAPRHGYDDNDPVEVILQGVLPNACYTLADTFYKHEDDGITIEVRQYAIKRNDDLCAQNATLPPHLAAAVPFTNSISLGTLPPADYTLSFTRETSRRGTRKLGVSPSPTSMVDTQPYAIVSTLLVPSMVEANTPTSITLNGLLNSDCVELSDTLPLSRERDVVVVLPVLRVKSDTVTCAQVLRPFSKKVELPGLKAGKTLIHVRSMNGKSLNAVVDSISN